MQISALVARATLAVSFLLPTSAAAVEPEAVVVDAAMPSYQPVEGVSGSLKSVGSDTMNNLMTYWGQLLQSYYPGVTVEITGKGSSTAPPALTEGTAQFGPMSRQMKDAEVDAFEARWQYEPTLMVTGIDCLAVFVHKDNPIESISLDDIRRAFSRESSPLTWGDLGVEDPAYQFQQITLYGRNSASGTYGYFKELALSGEDFKNEVKEQPGSSAVVQAVGTDPFGMGYSGLGFRTVDVKAIPVSLEGEPAVEPDAVNAVSGEYPLARFLYIYMNVDPARELEPLRREFVRLVYSREGQEQVVKDGYFPLPADIAREQLEALGIEPGF